MESFRFSHPYQYELDHLVMPESLQSKPEPQVSVSSHHVSPLICLNSFIIVSTNPKLTLKKTPIHLQMYKALSETSCQLINTLEDLAALNETLNKTTEFAVDLEVRMSVKCLIRFLCTYRSDAIHTQCCPK